MNFSRFFGENIKMILHNDKFIFCIQMICPSGKSLPNHKPSQVFILMQVTQSMETQQRV